MSDTAWKASERRIAKKLRGARTPLSGSRGGAGTSGDYVAACPGRTWLYGEFKLWTRAAILSLWRATKIKAKNENRHAVIVIQERGTANYIAVCDLDLFCKLLDAADNNGRQSLFE